MAMDGHDLEVLVSHTATLGWEKSGLATDAQEDVELATGLVLVGRLITDRPLHRIGVR